MEYWFIDENWVCLFYTKDKTKMREFLQQNPKWDKLLCRSHPNEYWRFITNRLEYSYNYNDIRSSSLL